MPKLLLAPSHKGWPNFQRLLLALLRFLEPYLRNAELTDAIRLLYKVGHMVLLTSHMPNSIPLLAKPLLHYHDCIQSVVLPLCRFPLLC